MYFYLCPFLRMMPMCNYCMMQDDPLPLTTFYGAIQQQQMMPPMMPYPREENVT